MNQNTPSPSADPSMAPHLAESLPVESLPATPAHDSLDWAAFRYVAGELALEEWATFEDRLANDQAAREAVAAAIELNAALRIAVLTDAETRLSASSSDVAVSSHVESHMGVANASGLDIRSRGAVSGPLKRIPRRRWRTVAAWLAAGSLACFALVALVEHWAGRRLRETASRSSADLGVASDAFNQSGNQSGNRGASYASSDSLYGQLARFWSENWPLTGGHAAGDPLASDSLTTGGFTEDALAAVADAVADADADVGDTLSLDDVELGGSLSAADAPAWMIAAVAATSVTMSDEAASSAREPTTGPVGAPDAQPVPGAIP
jgi:hypothetical protein